MKLAINCKWMSQSITGTQRYASEVCRQLLQDDRLEILLVVPKNAVVPAWVAGARVKRLPFNGILFEQFALPLWTFRTRLLNLAGPAPLLKFNQDVVIFDASTFRIPETYSTAFVLWYSVLTRVLVRTARTVFTCSHFSARELASLLRVGRSRLVVVWPGHEHAVAVDAQKPSESLPARFFLTVGTLAPHKNLARSVAEVLGIGLDVVVVGASGHQAVLRSQVIDSGATTRGPSILGRVTDEELGWLYENAVALIFPSLYEGFGLPIIEAQARGCPVISSNRASLPEVSESSVLYFDPDVAGQLADQASTLWESPAERARLREAGFKNVERFTWSKAARDIASAVLG